MGANLEKEVHKILNNPGNEEKVRKAFEHLDVDKSGSLTKNEWRAFARIMFNKDISDLKKEIRAETAGIPFAGMIATSLVNAAVSNVTQEGLDEYFTYLFEKCDKNGDGKVTYAEFQEFLEYHKSNRGEVTGLKTDSI